ncbi:efflux RND transporter permease subunit [Usitatibacter palustris]|uniref:Efflux pump membrane transporter BepE n=1 Tax=Usitatibacter palustris TaxID=2732487 RepID=A0A6M4H4T8_9PROT|nr:efflux RND transporter permease subunit [Usitatibacter palustris]QJR14185.1 Efflux pump membrane transporter BepE [Usitatibacter palustris]
MGFSGRIARFFQGSQLTPLLALLAFLLGLFAVAVTPREEEPQIDVTMANVFIALPGAAVRDVEALVASPAEQVLARMEGIEHVYSVSRAGLAVLTVQFKVGVPRTEAIVRLRDTLAAHRDWAPPELGVGEPVIKPRGIDDVPIVALTLSSDDPAKGAFELERVAHAIEAELKRVPGTRDVATLGGPGRVVRVLLDADRLAASGVTPLDVRAALQLANVALPAGSVVRDNREILVEAGAFLGSDADVREIVVGSSGGRTVRLGDVAEVIDGPDTPSRYVWTGSGPAARTGGAARGEHPAVTIQLTKKPGENAVKVAQGVMVRVAELRGTVIPADVRVTVTRNYGATADDKASSLIRKLVFATAAVIVLVLAALGLREAAIVGLAVVLTLMATLFASWAWGFTLNRVSLFALIFSIGILVDDAIVVVENIHRRRGLDGGTLADIVPKAVDEVGGPTILATLTVIAALLPMAFVSGLMGPYMSPIPINASLGMLISLAIAFTVTPWLALKLPGAHASARPSALDARLERFFRALLGPSIDAAGAPRRRRWLLAAIAGMLALAVGLAAVRLVVLKMLPFDNTSEFQVVVDLPTGTPVEVTAAALRDLGAHLATVPEVTDYQAYAGAASPINFNGLVRQYYLRSQPEQGDLQVNLVDKSQRSRRSHEIARAVRPALEAIGTRWQARVKVVEVPPGPPVLSPIVAEVYGPEAAGRIRVAALVREALAATPGVVGVDDTVDDPAPRYVLRVDQARAALAGVTGRDIAETLRMGLAGADVTPLHDGSARYEVPVRLTLPAGRRGDLEELLKLTLRGADGSLVALSELVRVARDERDRPVHHKDLLPVVYVLADEAGSADSPLYGLFAARGKLAGRTLEEGGTLGEYFVRQPSDPYRQYALKWDGEWQVTYETFRDMGAAYAVGLLLIYLLIVAQFRSYVVPLVIMAPIPLTLVGVMPGHALLGAHFTATSMIGMIALAGIIVRNSILLVDFVNLRLAAGATPAAAVVDAAAARAKPIALTALAAMLGAAFILDDPIFNGLAISLIFGILASTLLTLVVIPVLYYRVLAGSGVGPPK